MTEARLRRRREAFAEPADPSPGLVPTCAVTWSPTSTAATTRRRAALFPLLARRGSPPRGSVAVMLAEHAQARALVDRIDAAARGTWPASGAARRAEGAFAEYAALNSPLLEGERHPLPAREPRALRGGRRELVTRSRDRAGAGPGARRAVLEAGGGDRLARRAEDLSWGLQRRCWPRSSTRCRSSSPSSTTRTASGTFSHGARREDLRALRGAIGTEVQNCHPRRASTWWRRS